VKEKKQLFALLF